MTLRDPSDFQHLMLHAYVRNVMFFVTLPHHLAQETRHNRTCERPSQPAHDFRHDGVRWFR
jgi:hypothetical protein